ncbi:MAG: 4-(cytidine 5'-diphospho)-2-C-methyl-D-erythritol kinase [Ferruginibacter sp.]
MILFPNSKINLGLIVTGKRADGFHNIETVFYPLSAKDALEILPAKSNSTNSKDIGKAVLQNDISFTCSGINVDSDPSDNLCVKAYHLLKKDFPALPPTSIHLHKVIPIGAGLGGGSSDAAFTLMGLNEKYALGLGEPELIQYALQLGSDCPFFIINQPCLGVGRGELLEPLPLDLSSYQLVLINPGIHINTGWAFNQLKNKALLTFNNNPPVSSSLKAMVALPVSEWKDALHNEFEQPVFEKFPEISTIKESLYANGAIYASMSGSGSSVYGLFERNVNVQLQLPPRYLVKHLLL